MKCIRFPKTGEIRRVADQKALNLVRSNGWEYIPKAVWKEQVRDIKKSKKNERRKKGLSGKTNRLLAKTTAFWRKKTQKKFAVFLPPKFAPY